MLCWNMAGAEATPKGRQLNQSNPRWVLILTSSWDSSSSTSCWYVCVKSSVLKHWPPDRDAKMFSGFGMGCWSTSKAGFTVTLKSTQVQNVLSFLGTGTMGMAQRLNSTLVSTPSSKRFNSCASASLMQRALVLARKNLAEHVASPTGELVGSMQFRPPDETLLRTAAVVL